MPTRSTDRGAAGAGTTRFTLVVAIANPDHVAQLLRTAIDLAHERNGRIRVVSAVHRHVTSPFHLFAEERIRTEFADRQHAVIDEAMAIAQAADVPVDSSMPVGADISDQILSVIHDVEADALLLGWQERSRASDLVLGTTVDPLVRRAPCDVFIERVGVTADGIDRILVPTDGGPHAPLAAELASVVAGANDATIRIASYLPPNRQDRQAAQRAVDETAEQLPSDISWTADIEPVDDVSDAIVTAADDHDFLVLGATRERRLQQRMIGSVARSVGEQVQIPVVIARKWTAPSRLRRLLPW